MVIRSLIFCCFDYLFDFRFDYFGGGVYFTTMGLSNRVCLGPIEQIPNSMLEGIVWFVSSIVSSIASPRTWLPRMDLICFVQVSESSWPPAGVVWIDSCSLQRRVTPFRPSFDVFLCFLVYLAWDDRKPLHCLPKADIWTILGRPQVRELLKCWSEGCQLPGWSPCMLAWCMQLSKRDTVQFELVRSQVLQFRVV